MTRLVFASALACLVACGGAQPKTSSAGGTPVVAKRVSVSWGISPDGEMADLYLQTTDETGSQQSHELGRYKGTCAPATAAPEMNALTALDCKAGNGGTELQVVLHGGDELVIMQLGFTDGTKPDPMERQEVKRIKVPLGAKIEAGS
jgi:hypothetical protein